MQLGQFPSISAREAETEEGPELRLKLRLLHDQDNPLRFRERNQFIFSKSGLHRRLQDRNSVHRLLREDPNGQPVHGEEVHDLHQRDRLPRDAEPFELDQRLAPELGPPPGFSEAAP